MGTVERDPPMTAKELRRARKKLDLSNRQLAYLLNRDESTITRWQAGVRGIDPTAARVVRWMLDGYRPPQWETLPPVPEPPPPPEPF